MSRQGLRSFFGRSRFACAAIGAAVLVPNIANAAILSVNPEVEAPVGQLLPFSSEGLSSNIVTPGSNFSIAVVGFNANGSGSFLTAQVTPTFGTTTTYTGAALGSQVLTVASSESIGVSTTTDTFTISVPTNFDPSGTLVGSQQTAVTSMEADIGGYNAGADPITFLLPINPSTLTASGFMTYGGTSTFNLSPTASDVLDSTDTMLHSAEGVNAGGSALSSFAISGFTFSFTYATTAVPEPTTAGLVSGAAGFALLRRRKQARIV